MKHRMIVFVNLVLLGVGSLRAADAVERAKATAQAKHVGLLYDHEAAGPENVAQMSPCMIEENGKLYLFVNIGPRLDLSWGWEPHWTSHGFRSAGVH